MRPIVIPQYIKKHLKSSDSLMKDAELIREKIKSLQKGTPTVSVIIPAYNEQKTILRTLSSIADTQSKYSIEVIVVDNNSKDDTKRILLETGVRYIFEERQGVKYARTSGLIHAKGKYILNADADTLYSPYWIDCMIDPLTKNAGIALTYGKFAFIPEPGYSRLGFSIYELISDTYKKINGMLKDKAMYVYGCSSAYRKEQAIFVDGYEHPDGANEDGYLGLKLRNKFGKLKQVTYSKSYAWTSSRKFIADGSLRKRVMEKILKK